MRALETVDIVQAVESLPEVADPGQGLLSKDYVMNPTTKLDVAHLVSMVAFVNDAEALSQYAHGFVERFGYVWNESDLKAWGAHVSEVIKGRVENLHLRTPNMRGHICSAYSLFKASFEPSCGAPGCRVVSSKGGVGEAHAALAAFDFA